MKMDNKVMLGRFWEKVEIIPNGCWLWLAGTDSHGYGQFWYEGRLVPAHRYAFEEQTSQIPFGLQVDHLCRTRDCVNPLHMETVTSKQNILRGISPVALKAKQTHCIDGHPFTNKNTYRPPDGRRICLICRQYWGRRPRIRTKDVQPTASGILC